jgi:hypothetical protein
MAGSEFRVSEASRATLEPYARLPLQDPRRIELFSFLVDAVSNPRHAIYEADADDIRWSWLGHVAVVWRQDLVDREIDVLYVWDEVS